MNKTIIDTKNNCTGIVSFLLCATYSAPIYGNIVWPALFAGETIFNSLFLIIISIVIEALFFYWFINTITYTGALVMSCVGNAASAVIGTLIMTGAMLIWYFSIDSVISLMLYPFTQYTAGTLSLYNVVATWILMYMGSCVIEFFIVQFLFRYKTKQLLLPVVCGNFVTYVLVILFNIKELRIMEALNRFF